ncbi:ferrochelatase [Legionella maioricensis]|uniref:Ferrochelatase n=1 Tax=Legionella maioricensis TaxID=2896528 RepID=A0A9X2CZD4_9GAMM|nr:ferrochelatase [Legionella maioricensis]MCL9683298.1 ferrochelatase [Legionella maioricensis]MCL9686006.1 ferrochelatase [Legionella maioricensis]
MKRGLLLINLGTPNSTGLADVSCYLREFLTDKRVIDIPPLIRYLLVYALIVPLRAKKSAHAYKTIWTEQGSPLLFHSQNLANHLQKTIGAEYKIALGMRYGKPSITSAIHDLKDCESITVLPLYPQYSSAATGSSIEEVMRIITTQEVIPSLNIIRDFYHHPAYITSQAQIIKRHLHEHDHLLFSYHGIPERQIRKAGCKKVCTEKCPPISKNNQGCYKAQCHQTTQLLAKELRLSPNQYSTAFQSRLGKTPWIKPYTEEVLTELAAKGIKRLAISCPSFVADCLETLEEIGMRAREQWEKLGGEQFTMIPSLNDAPEWIKAIATIVKG